MRSLSAKVRSIAKDHVILIPPFAEEVKIFIDNSKDLAEFKNGGAFEVTCKIDRSWKSPKDLSDEVKPPPSQVYSLKGANRAAQQAAFDGTSARPMPIFWVMNSCVIVVAK